MAPVVWDSCGSDFVSLNLQITISVNWPLPCKLTTPQSCHHFVFQWLHSYFLGFFKHHLEKKYVPVNQVIQLSVFGICTYIAILKLQFRSKLKSDLSDTPTPIVFNTFTYKTLWSEIYSTISSNHVCSITVLSYIYVLKCLWIKVIHVFVLVVHFHPLKVFKGIGKAPLENLTDVQRMFYVIKCKTTCLFTSLLDFLKCWFWNLVPNNSGAMGW